MKKILIVEDEPIVALHLKSVLKLLGYNVVGIFPEGEEALKSIKEQKPDLILMDVQLGGSLDGVDTALAIKEFYDVPIIFLTAYSDEATINRVKATGPSGYLVKPFDEKELHISIEMALYKFSSEKKLKESEQRYNALFENSIELVYLHDFNGNFIDANQAALNLLGTSKEGIKKLNVRDIVRPDQVLFVFDLINELKNTGSLNDLIEFKIISLKGEEMIVEIAASLIIKNGEPYAIQGIGRDITRRKETEINLLNSESRLRTLIEGMNEGVVQVDNNDVIQFVNKRFCEITGYKESELIGKECYKSFLLEKDWNFLKQKNIERLQKNPDRYELQYKKKNGELFWVDISAAPLIDEHGNVVGSLGIHTDITAHKQAKEVLSEQEKSYRTLIETSIDAIYVLKGRRLLLVNPAWERLFGYSSDEATSEDFDIMKIVAPHDRIEIEERFKKSENRTVPKLESSRYEMTGVSKDGRFINLEVSVSRIIWKGMPAVQGLYRDITEQKKSQEQIQMLSLAVEQSPASIIITNTRGDIEYVNPKFTQITGYSLDEVIGKRPGILSTPNLTDELRKKLLSTISSGKEWRGEFLNRKKSGELYWESASISPIMDEHENITHYLSVQEDITLRKNQEQHLIIAKENAEKSDRLKTEFLAQMSHEIRTPLNNILTYTSVLKEEFEDKLPEGLESTFQVIDSSSQRLIRTIELILNLSRIQTGNFEIKFETIDLDKDLLEDIVIEFYSRAKLKNISLVYKNDADCFEVNADRYSLSQVFINLIDNAIKYTNRGEIKVHIYNSGSKVCVGITDTGIGISREYVPQLFNPFSQEDSGMTRHFEGIGLGLALVKKYTELNNAELNVNSEKGKGSTFTVLLPTAV